MTVYNAVWAALAAATAFAGPIPATYPNVSFPVKWGNGHVPICDWLTRVASAQGHADVDAARASVLATLAGVDAAQWERLNLDSLRPSIEGALRGARCAFNASLPTAPWRPWNESCLDAVAASPANHKIVHETPDVRIVNVFGAPDTIERFHTHRRLSFFVHFGLDHCGSYFYDEDYGIVNDEPDQSNATDPATGGPFPMVVNVLWMDAQWVHAVYYKSGAGDARCAQCPQTVAPAGCGAGRDHGFFYRFELALFPTQRPAPPGVALPAGNPTAAFCAAKHS